MSGWLFFWGLFLVASLVLFAGLVVVVTVRGYGDIRALIRGQKEKGQKEGG